MDTFDSFIAINMVADGYLISPQDAETLERRCSENIGDWEARWKLLGFYNAHQLCCPQNRRRRIENLIWTIDNVPEVRSALHSCLLPGPGDRQYVPQIRAAWQRRIDAAPNDPVSYENMGYFLRAVNPGEACSYYEKALSLDGDKANETDIATAKHLARHGADITSEDYGDDMPCIFDVLQAGDRLLQETRDRMQPSEADWNTFCEIAHDLVWNRMFMIFAQTACEVPVDSSASTICKSALRQMYKAIGAKSEVARTLRKPNLKALWNDLVMH